MNSFDFTSIPKILLILSVVILYVTVTFAIIKSLVYRKKRCSPYHVDIVCSPDYKGIEKRRMKRFCVSIPAYLERPAQAREEKILIRDISSLGMRCEMESPDISLNCGEKAFIRFPASEEDMLHLACRIVWKKMSGSPFSFGIEILEKNPLLESFVSSMKPLEGA